MNATAFLTALFATPADPSHALAPSALAPTKPAPKGFRLRSYTPDAYGASFHRPLYGRYIR